MGEDLSTGAKIGIILIILCSLIAIVFALLTVMKNITNSGSAQLQSSLDQMLLTTFDDYNQKTVSGIQVKSALRIFEAQDVAIIVKTGLCNTGGDTFLGGYNYNAVLCGYTNKAQMPGYGTVYYSSAQINTTPATVGNDTVIGVYDPNRADDLKNGLKLHQTGAYYLGELYKQDGRTSVEYNMNTKPLDASSNKSFVRTNARYRAMLVKDSAGTNIGIVFNEIVTD